MVRSVHDVCHVAFIKSLTLTKSASEACFLLRMCTRIGEDMKAISSTWLCFFLIISSSVQGKKPANNNCTVVDTVSFLIYSFRPSDQSGIGLIRLKSTKKSCRKLSRNGKACAWC